MYLIFITISYYFADFCTASCELLDSNYELIMFRQQAFPATSATLPISMSAQVPLYSTLSQVSNIAFRINPCLEVHISLYENYLLSQGKQLMFLSFLQDNFKSRAREFLWRLRLAQQIQTAVWCHLQKIFSHPMAQSKL